MYMNIFLTATMTASTPSVWEKITSVALFIFLVFMLSFFANKIYDKFFRQPSECVDVILNKEGVLSGFMATQNVHMSIFLGEEAYERHQKGDYDKIEQYDWDGETQSLKKREKE